MVYMFYSVAHYSVGWLQLLYVYKQLGGGYRGIFSLLRLACTLFVCLSTHI